MKIRVISFYCALLAVLAACQSSGAPEQATPTPTTFPATRPPPTPSTLPPDVQLTPIPVSRTPTPQALPTQPPLEIAQECESQWLEAQDPEKLDCAFKAYQQVIDRLDQEDRPYYQYLLDRLYWQSGQNKELARERILTFIRQNLQNDISKDAIEFFWSEILPEPTYYDAGESLAIYKKEIIPPYMIAHGPGAELNIRDTNVPGNLFKGKNAPALEVDWVKDAEAWASLVLGFDERLADKRVAQAGELISLANPEIYRLEFIVKAGPGLHLWEDAVLRIKLQDQNLLVKESIGNQLVCHVRITEDWVAYSIPLSEFVQDQWVLYKSSVASPAIWGGHPSFVFDWTRLKQINIDVPYGAQGQGIFILDNIALVRDDAPSDLQSGNYKMIKDCLEALRTINLIVPR